MPPEERNAFTRDEVTFIRDFIRLLHETRPNIPSYIGWATVDDKNFKDNQYDTM